MTKMPRCEHCGMKEDGYLLCRRPVVWKDKDGEKHLICCGLDKMLMKSNYPEEDGEVFNKIVALFEALCKIKGRK